LSQDLKKELDGFSKEDIAAGLQKQCEEIISHCVKYWMTKSKKLNVKNVCLAGGVFSNVKINQIVAEMQEVENVYVFPHMGDGGLPVGSSCYFNYKLSGQTKIDLPTAYLGPRFSNDEILRCLHSYASGIKYEKLNRKAEAVVDELMNKKVVGYFCNKMEYGPRALGARSILYHARDDSVNDWLNKRLKRTEFMPFGPVTPVEYAHMCYKNWTKDDKCSNFMTKTYNCFEEFKKLHKAVVHIDGTARPQIVTKELNGVYYEIVKLYCDKTNEKALINTSFNLHEEPIICTPQDAIKCLLSNCIDVLIIEDYKVYKV
jgi:carbamoyltransferase|tara:strand:+ start:2127 stop:3074 length:948 start_codon:yes stop_codon:yes gene_type:complete